MVKRIISRIVKWLIDNDEIEQDDYELYEFAIYSLIFTWSPLILAIVIGIIMEIPIKAIIMIIPFMIIRKFSGGYHINNPKVCFCVSCFLMIIFIGAIKSIKTGFYFDVMVYMSVALIVCKSPIDSEKRKLLESEKKRFKCISRNISIILLLIYLVVKYLNSHTYAVCIGLSLILTGLLMLPYVFLRHN